MQLLSTAVFWIIAIFAVLGFVDRIVKEWKPDLKLPLIDGYGAEMEEGFAAMAPIALAQVGIIAVTPVLTRVLIPFIGPLYTALLSRPALFAGTLTAIDMGATPMGLDLARAFGDPEWIGYYGGLLLGSMFGVNLVFNIPVGLAIIPKEDYRYLGLGVLAGIVMTPIGVIVSGLLAGYPLGQCVIFLVPVVIVAVLIAIGLVVVRDAMLSGFVTFGHAVVSFIMIFFAIAIFAYFTGVAIVPGMSPMFAHIDAGELIWEGFEVVGAIAIALAGAFPLVKFLGTVLSGPLAALGRSLGMTEIGAVGLLASLANNIAMYGTFKDMTPRGKVLNGAFQVGAAFTIADHLAFAAANAPHLIGPMMIGKVVAGVLGLLVATMIAPKE